MIKHPCLPVGAFHYCLPFFFLTVLLLSLLFPCSALQSAWASNQTTLANLIHKAADNWQQRDFDEMLPFINIEGGKDTEEFLRLLDSSINSINTFNGVPATQQARDKFRASILEELDARRFAQVDDILREAATKFPNLEAAVRTGSSGLRHLGKDAGGGYRPLLSDDDITFVGEGAQEAKTWFNQQVKSRGLGGVKVKGFTLNDPGKFSRQDKAILDLLDPEKFVGQSAMSGIRGETMKKGAVVLAKGPDGKLVFTRVSLADHLSSLKTTKSALDSFIDSAARKYGPLTMTASVERQIVDAHKGWDNLTGSEKVKYMLRSRKKLNESRGVAADASVGKLEEMASRFSRFPPPDMTPDEAAFLLKLRRENIVEGFKAANNRLFLQSLNARQAGGNLAANPQVRAAIDELATGFAMLKDLGGKPEFRGMVDVNEMIEELIKNADGNPELKKMLYTASKQADDMLAVLKKWAGMEDEFAAMLARLPSMTPAQRAKALADRKAMLSGAGGQARKNELALVDEMSKAAATKEGDALIVAMIKSPAGKKVLVALALSGGGVAFSKMNERWKDGGWYGDLSSAASTLADFLPGAMSFERMKQDGYLSPGLAYQFVKEAMYLTPVWPAALSADLAEMAYGATRAVTLSNYKEDLVYVLETYGDFKNGRFTALKLAGGETIPRDRLAAFFKEDKTVKLANTNKPDLSYNFFGKAADVYANHYVENDPVLGDLKKALILQIGRINVGQAMGQLTDHEWLEAAKSGFRMLFAVEGVCTKLPKQWCELVTIYQTKIKDRTDDIFPNVMVPHLISLAEDAHKALTGSDEAVKRIMEIQRELESLRGSPLGVDLAQEVAQRAARASDFGVAVSAGKTAIAGASSMAGTSSLSGEASTKRDEALAEGEYLQAAVKAYETILKEARDSLQDIVDRTGYKEARVLAFPFSGDFFQDAAKARQSRRGFMSATNSIVQDVAKIKGSAPDVLDETDLKALGILAEVAYRNRAALDAANSAKADTPKDPAATPIPDLSPPMAGKDSPYHTWYKEALEKVKALYAKAVDLKKLVAKGVMLVPPGKEMVERVAGVFEARITDPALRTMLNEGKVLVEWSSDQYGAAFSDARSLKTSFTPDEPGQATVRATFSLKAEPAVEASVQAKVTVRPADKPSVSLTLHPGEPQPSGTVTASALPDSSSARGPLVYDWSCENCQIVDRRSSQALVRAPEKGGAEVQVRMKREDGKELAQASARFTVAAPPDDKKDPPKPKTDKDAQDDKDAKGSKEGKGDKTSGPDQPGADGKTPLDKTPGPVFPPVPPVTPPPAVVPPSTVTPQGQTGAQPTKPGDQGQPPKTGQPGADVQKPSTGADSGQKPLVPEDPQRPKDKEAKDPAIDLSDMVDSLSSKSGVESWREALSLRAEMKKKLAVPSLAAKEKRAYEERLQYAEGMLKHYWNNARSNFDGLPEHLARWRDEAGRAYDDVLKNQPKASGPAAPRKPSSQFEPSDEGMKPVPLEQAAPSKAFERRQGPVTKVNPAGDERKGYHSSTVTNLEGETPDSVPDVFDKACFERVKRARDEYVGRLDQRAREAKAIWDILSGRGDPDAGYEAAMTRADQFWMNAGGVPPFDWKTKPVQVYVETCGGPSRKVDIAPPKQSAPPALKVELRIDGKQSAPGKPVTVVAMALGGKPPYTYVFKGAETSRENSATYAIPEGKKHVVARVQAFDSAGQTAYGDLSLAGEAVTLKLGKTAPAGNALAAGAEARFEAQLMSEGKPADASAFVIRWEPSTEARFARNEGQGLLTNTATFTRPGKVKVWAVALRKDGAALTTVAESNQIELEVAGTSITLTASPAEPLVGQEVTVTAVENPKVLDADAAYWWDDSQGGAGTGPTANQRQWKFTVKEAKPVTVNAMLKGKKGGEDLARASLTVTPKSYQVTAVSLGHTWGGETTRPVVWKPGVGLVALDKEIAAHMDVGLRADVSPAPPQGQALRYKWTVNEGSTLSGNPASRETRAQRSSKGSIEAKVEVRDGNNALLGTGSVSVPVTVSDEDIKQGKAKAQELEKLKQEAAAAWNAGDIDLACDKAKAAAQIDPKFPDVKTYCDGREHLLTLAKQGEDELGQDAPDRAQTKLDEAKRINAKAKVLAALEEKIKKAKETKSKAEDLLAQAARKWTEGDAEGAERLASEALALAPKMDRAKSEKQRYAEGLSKLKASLEQAKSLQSKGEIDPALTAVTNGKGVNAAYKPLLDLEKELMELKKKKQELAKLLVKSKKHWDDGEVDEACQTAQEAVKFDPASSEAKAASGLHCQGRDAIAQAVKQGEAELTADHVDKAQTQLEAGRKINAKAKSLAVLEEKIKQAKDKLGQVEKLLTRAAREWSDGEADKAAATVEEALKVDPKHDKAQEEKKSYSGRLDKLHFAVGEAKNALNAKDTAKGMAAVADGKAISSRYKPLLAVEAELEKLTRESAQNEAERKRRTDLIVSGAGECTKENWQACKEKLTSALNGSEKVFGPQDAEMVGKANALLAKAEQGLAAKKQTEAKDNAERSKRLELIASAAQLCNQQHWFACKSKLDEALLNADAVLGKSDPEVLNKAKALHAKAMQSLETGLKENTRKQRLDDIVAASADCGKENWESCRDRLGSALQGAEKDFGPQDAELLKKAKDLKAKAEQKVMEKNKTAQLAVDSGKPSGGKPPESAREDTKKQCDKLFEQAKSMGDRGESQAAVRAYKELLSICPDNCGAMNNIGVQMRKQGDAQAALSWYESARKCNPDKELYKNNVESAKAAIASEKASTASPAQTTAPTSSPPASSPASTQPSGGSARFDGTYAGRFTGEAQGNVNMVISGGVVSGTVGTTDFTLQLRGSVDASGKITAQVSGAYKFGNSSYPVNGTVSGSLEGAQAKGNWFAKGWVEQPGTWSATRQGGAASSVGGGGKLTSYNGIFKGECVVPQSGGTGVVPFTLSVNNGKCLFEATTNKGNFRSEGSVAESGEFSVTVKGKDRVDKDRHGV